jgi:hypothetical protein
MKPESSDPFDAEGVVSREGLGLMEVSKMINVSLWDRARWNGTVFGMAEGEPPFLALAFENAGAGIEIFKELRAAVGEHDHKELIRIAIIEGAVPGRDRGYSVHIGPRPEVLLDTTEKGGEKYLAMFMRMHRMNPAGGESPHLAAFKTAFAQQGRFWFMAASMAAGGGLSLDWDHAISKTRIEWRNIADVERTNDIDSLVYGPDPPRRETLQ